MNRRCLLLVILLVLLPTAMAEFTIDAQQETIETCPTSINLFTIPITNIGSSADIYTVSLSGSAAKWAVAAPPGFVIAPGSTQLIFVYATPPKGTPIGTYYLDITVDDGKAPNTITETILVKECFGVSLSIAQAEKTICSCEEVDFLFKLSNTGKFTENYKLTTGGSSSRWTTLSKEFVRLPPGESEDIIAHMAPGCENIGVYGLTLTVKSETSEAVASSSAGLVVRGCYDFGLYPEKNYYSFCENSEIKMPITLENEGSSEDSYVLSSTGPGWVTLDKKELTISGKGGAAINLVAFPSYGVSGNYPVKVSAESDKGGQVKTADLSLNVLTCYATGLSLSIESDSLCPGTEAQHAVLLTNAGNFEENYALSVSGAEWVSLSQSSAVLQSGESANVDLILSPRVDIPAGKYSIVVNAEAQSTSKTSDNVVLDVEILDKDKCYNVDVLPELDRTEVDYGGSSLVPITVENLGVQKIKYTLDVSGNGASYVQLNPSALEIEGGKSKKTYLYISAPDRTTEATYSVLVSARDEHGVVSSSDVITFDVVEEVSEIKELPKFELPKVEALSGWTTGLSDLGASLREGILETPYVAEGYDWLKERWYIGIAIIMVILILIALAISKLLGGEEGDEFIDDFYEKKKPKKEKGLWKRFTDWLSAEDLEEFEVGWEPKKKPAKKEKGAWDKFMDWLEAEESVKERPRKKEEGLWDKFNGWLEEEPKKPAKKSKSAWDKFSGWLEEEEKPKPKPKKGKGAWDKFLGWLEEEEAPKKKVKKRGKKGAWDKFMDWLEED